jgi:hypothetical protein
MATQARLAQRRIVQPGPTFATPSPQNYAANRAYYSYVARFTAIAAAGAAAGQANITIDNDADFDWMYSTFWATIGDVAQTDSSRLLPTALVDIATQDTQRLSNLPVPIASIFGDGTQPLVLPTARRLPRRTTLNFTVTNLGADAINLWLVLMGQKVYT